ncbi:hypothetical protein JVX91_20120 [Pseudomonas sp. PDNC002]|uniref:hypothetical protein n=1 Tax=Pseudomonas sp. PDNC002 TaxID=2811422 RepID=UPI001965315B|nr:hypothetical protein [Pseudomonas sp. PDNC002]QRY77891.1 hypothetical protein JVX91_20120 [Pseudomonas sp. PDNC002]
MKFTEVSGDALRNSTKKGREELSGIGLEQMFHNFPADKKRPPGEAAKPKDDEVEQFPERSGAGIRDSCSSSGRKLNGHAGKC